MALSPVWPRSYCLSQFGLVFKGTGDMSRLALRAASAALFATASVVGAPLVFSDLGTIGDTTATYATPDFTFSAGGPFGAGDILWLRFQFAGTSGTSLFLDIDTTTVGMAPATSASFDTELGLYGDTGALIANNDDSGQGLYSRLSFGSSAGPRTYDVGGGIAPLSAITLGRDGALAPGTYWLAVGRFNTTFGATDWTVTGGSADADPFDVNFRTDALGDVPEPGTYALLGAGMAALAMIKRRG